MKVRALRSFVDERGRHEQGDILEMVEGVALKRIEERLVEAVRDEPAPRTATSRKLEHQRTES